MLANGFQMVSNNKKTICVSGERKRGRQQICLKFHNKKLGGERMRPNEQ